MFKKLIYCYLIIAPCSLLAMTTRTNSIKLLLASTQSDDTKKQGDSFFTLVADHELEFPLNREQAERSRCFKNLIQQETYAYKLDKDTDLGAVCCVIKFLKFYGSDQTKKTDDGKEIKKIDEIQDLMASMKNKKPERFSEINNLATALAIKPLIDWLETLA